MKIKNELAAITLCALPAIYLASIWGVLPEKIPTHWNFEGEIDSWGSKKSAIYMALFPVITYLTFLIIPKIDPKKKLQQMGAKYQQLKFVFLVFTSALAIAILYITKTQNFQSFRVEILIGFLFILLGNYFQTVKPNYFIGIKTPWTLESESVWRKTHQLGGKLWLFGGILIVLLSLLLNKKYSNIAMLSIVAIVSIIPIVYSYTTFKKEAKN